MENGKRKTESKEASRKDGKFSVARVASSPETVCPACGTETERRSANFCRVCGKRLLEDYEPLDRLRSSYRMQGKRVFIETPPAKEEIANLFAENKNSASEMASAFVVYSLVPYLGILFCPGAVLMGGIGFWISSRKPYLGGAKTSAYSIALGIIILVIQLLLWWLLYLIPDLGK